MHSFRRCQNEPLGLFEAASRIAIGDELLEINGTALKNVPMPRRILSLQSITTLGVGGYITLRFMHREQSSDASTSTQQSASATSAAEQSQDTCHWVSTEREIHFIERVYARMNALGIVRVRCRSYCFVAPVL